jgi:hypothetical protein
MQKNINFTALDNAMKNYISLLENESIDTDLEIIEENDQDQKHIVPLLESHHSEQIISNTEQIVKHIDGGIRITSSVDILPIREDNNKISPSTTIVMKEDEVIKEDYDSNETINTNEEKIIKMDTNAIKKLLSDALNKKKKIEDKSLLEKQSLPLDEAFIKDIIHAEEDCNIQFFFDGNDIFMVYNAAAEDDFLKRNYLHLTPLCPRLFSEINLLWEM